MDENEQKSLREKLQSEIGNCSWSHLKDHSSRGALIFVASSLELVEVATAVAQDDSHAIQGWLDQGLLTKPTAPQIEHYASDPNALFRFAIVQPFVLATLLNN